MSRNRRYLVPSMPEQLAYLNSGKQLVFHGINKSGSLAMANVLKESFDYFDRSAMISSHYHTGGTVQHYIKRVNANATSNNLLISHYLYGALTPRPDRVWMTQFRHPLPRILSCYQWLKNKFERLNGDDSFMTLDEFILNGKGISNSQVLQLAFNWGDRRKMLSKRLDPLDMLYLSMDAIERDFSMIGIAEFFEESIFMFASLCGLSSVMPWIRDIRNPGRPHSSEVPLATVELIKEVYQADFLLYDWALARFHSQVNLFEFDDDLIEFKNICSMQYNDRILNI